MAGDVNQRACVVEVVEQVPEADVAIVAARVGERLAMAPERVRKLIEGRTGPITRALRPDKADAIAQTFEAAGVRVVIRPAEPEELEVPSAAVATATAERAPAAVPPFPTEPERFGVQGPESERGDAPDPELADAPDPEIETDPEVESDPEIETDYAPDPEIQTDYAPDPDAAADDASDAEIETDYAPDYGDETDDARDPEAGTDDAPDPEIESDDAPDDGAVTGDAPDLERGTDDTPGDGPEPESEIVVAPERMPQPWARVETDPALEAGYAPDDAIVVDDDDDDDRTAAQRSKFTSTGEWVAGDAGVWSTSRPPRPSGEAGVWTPDADDDDEADGEVHVAPPGDEGDDPILPDARRDRGRPDVSRRTRRPQAVAMPVVDDASLPRQVPMAWRGLGPEPAGPARPLDANLPRRVDLDEPIDDDEPRRRRRGIMLILLAVAVVGFLLSQWWVASRAGAALDASAGFHAYRDGDFAAARRYWGAQASAGDPAAQFMLGYLAEAGLGAPWSARAAAAWYRAAADGGHAEAAWRLGRLYEAGLGVAPDDAEARRWFRRASDLGHAEAAFAWGRSWMRELGVVWGRDGVEVWPAGVIEELSTAFERAASLGFHEAAPYAASLATARAAGLPAAVP
jgi:hypothetical protein